MYTELICIYFSNFILDALMNNSYIVVALKGTLVYVGGQTSENTEVTIISLVIHFFSLFDETTFIRHLCSTGSHKGKVYNLMNRSK